MITSDKGRALLREFEGVRREPYHDIAGLLTIGVGHLLTKHEIQSGEINIGGENVKYADGLTDPQIDQLLAQDLSATEAVVNNSVNVDLNQNQFDALVSFVFNIGGTAFSQSTLLKYLNSGMYKDAEEQMLRWNKAGGKISIGLSNRRARESKLFQGGNNENAA